VLNLRGLISMRCRLQRFHFRLKPRPRKAPPQIPIPRHPTARAQKTQNVANRPPADGEPLAKDAQDRFDPARTASASFFFLCERNELARDQLFDQRPRTFISAISSPDKPSIGRLRVLLGHLPKQKDHSQPILCADVAALSPKRQIPEA